MHRTLETFFLVCFSSLAECYSLSVLQLMMNLNGGICQLSVFASFSRTRLYLCVATSRKIIDSTSWDLTILKKCIIIIIIILLLHEISEKTIGHFEIKFFLLSDFSGLQGFSLNKIEISIMKISAAHKFCLA